MSCTAQRAADGWCLVYDGYDPATEGRRESLCAIGNGYFVTRAAAVESTADTVHYPGTYVAGLYNRLLSEIDGRTSEDESLVNLPNWLPLTFRIDDGEWFDIDRMQLLAYRQVLDLRRGVLNRSVRVIDADGRITRIETMLFAHMTSEHVGVLSATINAENWSGTLTVLSALDGRVDNAGVARYRAFNGSHLEMLGSGCNELGQLWLRTRTVQSRIEIAIACEHRVQSAKPLLSRRRIDAADPQQRLTGEELSFDMEPGGSARVDKVVAIFTSRDPGISECTYQASESLSRAGSVEALLASHQLAWERLWRRFDLAADVGADTMLALRLHAFQLLQTASPNTMDLDAGIPARGWHGEAYRGHIFWDELFVFPFLNYRMPEVARALLLYRYRRLPAARAAARAAGYAGAMYPWQSGSDGREETQRWNVNPRNGHLMSDHTYLQRHIGSAVAYNLWAFEQVTGDHDFLSSYGAEMMLEIARFWSSIAVENRARGRYEIHRVMGPDEFHDRYPDAERPGLSNNAYTNVMAAWVLWRALGLLERVSAERRRELIDQLALSDDELQRWDMISRNMYVPFHEGVISQFEGYEALHEFDWEGYRQRYGDIHRLDHILEAEGDTPNRYKLSKQADVLMLFYLFDDDELRALFGRLGYRFDESLRTRTTDYYLARTSHGSTLSRVVHSWVFARDRHHASWSFFSQALQSDLADVQGGSTAEGIHLGAMAGTIDLVQRGYTGLTVREQTLVIEPCLPEPMSEIDLRLRFRGAWLVVNVRPHSVTVGVAADATHALRVDVRGDVQDLEPGAEVQFTLVRAD